MSTTYAPPTNNTPTSTTGNPLQPVYQAAPPQVAPTTSNYDVSPNHALSQLTSANALTNAQAYGNLNNTLAAEGISGNDAIAADSALSGQLTASQAPTLASLIQGSQQMGLGQSEFNAGAGNTASGLNLSALLGVNSANQNAANNSGLSLAQMLMQNYGLDFGAFTNLLDASLGGQQSLQNAGAAGQINLNNNANQAQNYNLGSIIGGLFG